MAKSALYAVNSAAQVLAVNGSVNFGTPIRRFGCNTNILNGNPFVVGSGYYDVETNITFTPSATGTAIFTIYKDGVAVPGASASMSVTAADVYAVTVPAIIRQYCDCDSTVSVILTGVAATVNNAAISIEKL